MGSSAAKKLSGRVKIDVQIDVAAANEFEPEYVKNILKKSGMINAPVIPISKGAKLDKLTSDPEIKMETYEGNDVSNFYLALLADVFIGDPSDRSALWIARFRFALGLDNTFIFTNSRRESVLSKDNHYLLYDARKIKEWH